MARGTMSKKSLICCNFCGKNSKEIGFLIQGTASGNDSYICKKCTDICVELFIEKDNLKLISKNKKSTNTLKSKKKIYPKNIKEFLDLHVIGQNTAKIALSIAVANHFKRINNIDVPKYEDITIAKTNVLLLGPTGSGKTLLVKKLAEYLNVPFAIGDATSLTEAGYVGEDVETLITSLLRNCNYDLERAKKGIIYIDEIDKIARSRGNVSISRDVSGEGVQQSLLKIIEGTISSVPPEGGRKHPEQKLLQVDTTNILFIIGGCFDGIDEIAKKRLGSSRMGFHNIQATNSPLKYMPEDIVNFGMIPEFVGRFPLIQNLEKLQIEDLVRVISEPKNCILKQYKKLYAMDKVELEFSKDALYEIAKYASEMETGARGISQIFEIIMFNYNFNIHQYVNKKITIDKNYVLQSLSSKKAV